MWRIFKLRKGQRPHKWRRTTLFTLGLMACLVGLALGKYSSPLSVWWCVPAFLVVLGSYRRRSYMLILSVIIFGGMVGYWRGSQFAQSLAPYSDLYDHNVSFTGVATEDAVYGKNGQITFDVSALNLREPTEGELPGHIKVSGFGENMVYRGDEVQISGKLRRTLGGKQGQMSFVQFSLVARGDDPANRLRERFGAGMQNTLPEPVASFGLGILIGQRSTLPQEVSQQLSTVGLTHLIAVSGYNLTIIVMAARRIMGKRSKYQSTLLALGLIGGFLLITGFSASIVRAAVVSGLTIWAWYYGRTIKPLLLLSLAGVITAGWYPLYLWGDIGWYLSFLAFFGVLMIAPAITKRLYGKREPKLLQAVLIETVSAQVMTLPLILYVFQQVSPVSIISNVLIVPLVPYAMLLSGVAGAAGALLPIAAGWVAWPARLLLTYMLDVANVLSRAPGALLHYSLPLWGLITGYSMIVFTIWVMWRKLPKITFVSAGSKALSANRGQE